MANGCAPDSHTGRREKQLSEAIEQVIRAMSASERQILNLYYVLEQTPAVIAKSLGTSPKQVRSEIDTLRDRIRQQIDRV